MSKAMNLNVVAEGVETEDQLKALQMLGCQEIQGFLVSQPMSGNVMFEWLQIFGQNNKSQSILEAAHAAKTEWPQASMSPEMSVNPARR